MVSKRKSSEGSGSAPVSNDTEAETELLKMSLNISINAVQNIIDL